MQQLDIKSRTVRQNRTNSRTSTGVDNHWTYTEEQSAIHSTSGQSAGHLLKDHQQNILLEIINKTSTWGLSAGLYWRTNSRTSNGPPSTGHYTAVYLQDIYWQIISRTSNGGSSAGSTGGSSTGHLLEDHQQDRTSTCRSSAGHLLQIISRTFTGRSSAGHLLENHQQDI